MSKIVCDMCGTAYPETADQCPICGCAKGENPQLVADDTPMETKTEGTRTPVKGGRFSKANVRKRNKAAGNVEKAYDEDSYDRKPKKSGSNKGLLIVVLILLLAIIAVIGFIVIRYFLPADRGGKDQTEGTTTASTTLPENTEPKSIPCESLTLSTAIVELEEVNEAWLLNVTASPENTTDTVAFSSSDEAVATVTDKGRITAVGAGQAVITVTCGDQEVKCRVVCNIPEETHPTDPTEPSETTEPVDGDAQISLNREDFTLSQKGATWSLYNGEVAKNLVTFSSDDETVAKFENGTVTAVGSGMTTVYAEYGDQKVSCIVRCSFPPDEGELGGNVSEAPSGYSISHTDVTLAVGETFKLTLKDGSGNAVSVEWKIADSSICSVSGNTVTGLAAGTTTVSVEYGGETYNCTVRVKPAT